ncbi:cell division protein ZapA [Sandarakinorhabdus rubra]|uniref:cell division protein ZapA n=1 Tax=Sandarakinorhabdus rubra TaxID=2672568 RepID=UPI0013D994A2|nr:cell division protein ZapA [Sandarakinorhabdus rubra]
MGQAMLSMGGRQYRINCRDGDEPRIVGLGEELAARADRLTRNLGPMPEAQLLAMVALTLADELADARSGAPSSGPVPPMLDITRLTRIVERLEALASA